MKPYAWSCLACEASNPPESTQCERCRCLAQATAAQVEAARRTWRLRSGLTPVEPFDLLKTVQEFPLLLIAAAVLAGLGGVALIVSTGASFSAFGALLIALGALCLSSYRPRPAQA